MKQILFAAALMLVRMDQSPFVLAPGREKKPAFPLSGRTRGGATGKSNFWGFGAKEATRRWPLLVGAEPTS
jgi:hypothetical protein